jgi:predicted  nucleic acid-binding Zn-ribbon protein
VDFTVLRQPNTQQLETLVARLESLVRDHEGPDALLESSTNDDAPYLDADAYTSYLDKMNMDGSLSTGMGLPMDSLSSQQGLSSLFNPSPLISNSYYSTNQTASLQDLLQTQPGRPDDVDEELHKQIMSQELGFQQQSEEFLSHLLSTNETTGRDAAYRLREQRRIQEQRQFLEQLDREMQDLENELEETTSRPNASVCSKCGCALTPTEVERSEKICSVCFADQIASSSDMRFLEQPSFRRPYQDSYRMQRPPNQSAGNVSKGQRQNNFVESRRVPVSDDSNQLALKRQVAALQQQVQKYKRQSELAERQVEDLEAENHKLRQLVAELEVGIKVEQEQPVQSGPWMQVVDPDTGEVFYWNEETEEMSWEPPE